MNRLTLLLATCSIALTGVVVGQHVGADEGTPEKAAAAATAQTEFVGIDPFRTYDTRQGSGEFGKFIAGEAGFLSGHRDNQFFGSNDVKLPIGASAIAFNVAAFQTEGTGFVQIAPCSATLGSTATVKLARQRPGGRTAAASSCSTRRRTSTTASRSSSTATVRRGPTSRST